MRLENRLCELERRHLPSSPGLAQDALGERLGEIWEKLKDKHLDAEWLKNAAPIDVVAVALGSGDVNVMEHVVCRLQKMAEGEGQVEELASNLLALAAKRPPSESRAGDK